MAKKFSDTAGGKILQGAHNKVKQSKGNTEMKNIKENQVVITIVTVLVTLLTVAAFGTTYYFGMQHGASNERSVSTRIEAAKTPQVSKQ